MVHAMRTSLFVSVVTGFCLTYGLQVHAQTGGTLPPTATTLPAVTVPTTPATSAAPEMGGAAATGAPDAKQPPATAPSSAETLADAATTAKESAASLLNALDAPKTPAAREHVPSVGTAPVSIFFTPAQVTQMREALETFEVKGGALHTGDAPIAVTTKEAAPQIVEPGTYPVFHLTSIAYRAPNDWSVWVSGHKITSHKNTTSLKVVSVSSDQAQFLWAPTYAEALATRKKRNLFAPTDHVKHKLTKTSAYRYDEAGGTVTFTLRPNQSFVAAYMNTFEGYVQSPSLPPLVEPKPGDAKTATGGAASTGDGSSQQQPQTFVESVTENHSRSDIDAQLKRQEAPATPPAIAPPPAPKAH